MEAIDIQRNALRRRDDGTIALPESVNLPAKSEEAQLASVRNVPDEMEDVVGAMLKARRTSYSIIQLLGLLLFMISDHFLVIYKFKRKQKCMLRANTASYFLGMMLVALSFSVLS